MAQSPSFDIVSEINLQEVDNAVNQASKEILQRYDFRDSKTSIVLDKKERKLTVDTLDDFHLRNAVDILQSKLVKRGVPLKALQYGSAEPSSGGTVRQIVTLRVGIDKDNAKTVLKHIKDTKLKVQAQIMDDQIRVSGKSKDDLQQVIQMLNTTEFPFALQCVNYR
jgi:cyclic-di-GMP-binding protein